MVHKDRLIELKETFDKLYEDLKDVPDELQNEAEEKQKEGFLNWTKAEFDRFLRAFMKRDPDDIYRFASDVRTKTPEEVQEYMQVFLNRYRELAVRSQVFQRLRELEFQKQNEETILNVEKYKDYNILLNNQHYYDQTCYKDLLLKEHHRLTGEPLDLDTAVQL